MIEPNAAAESYQAPLISVIIPCYNQGHFLGEAINSALSQTHPNIEIIVVDDGSTDNTAEVAASYGVRCVRQENQGLGPARNSGLREARGNYLVFLDADDRLHPRAIETSLKELKLDPDAAFVYGRCQLIAADGSFLSPSRHPHIESDHYLNLLKLGNFMPNPAAFVFRRAPLEAVGGFRPPLGTEDYDMLLRLTRLYSSRSHKEVVADYRQHEESLTQKPTLMSESTRSVLESQLQFVSGHPFLERAWKQGVKQWRRYYFAEMRVARARENARSGRWSRVMSDVLWLLLYEPGVMFANVGRKVRVLLSRRK